MRQIPSLDGPLKPHGDSRGLCGGRQFDPQALLDAVDEQRRQRGLTWAELSRELGISASTIRNMPKRKWGIELDGVIGLCRWLGKTVESFAGGDGGPAPPNGVISRSGQPVRFDTAALHAALNDERVQRGMTWDQVAAEVWPLGPWGAEQLERMEKGGRSDVYNALAICEWLGMTIQSFQRETWF
jgi:transcriptional regulator with XRE-family HTH domain